MFTSQTKSRLAGVAVCATLGIAVSAPLRADEAWEKLLRIQLEETHKCILSGTVFVREMPSGEGITYSGRAKCFDGRDFDFSQSKPHMKFDIKSCDPTVC
ncbi:MAG: hypothetical protein HOP09_03530 [Hyphomicrobium sp.]|nr:hypothetical protein [Hyphomicrobium sp.]